jgi:ATP-binding cassette, subfamily B, multidrug efflux pump
VAYWGAGGANGWSGGMMAGPNAMRRGLDGWNDEALGKLYDHKVMSRLVPYLKPYPWRVVGALVGVVGYAVASYAQPALIGLATRDILNGDLDGLNRHGLILIGLALTAWFFQWVQLTCAGYIGHHILLTLRQQMFDHLQKLSLGFYNRHEVGRVMSRVTSDVTSLQELLTSGLLTVIADFAGLIVVVVVLLALDWQLALVTFAVVPLLVLGMALWQKRAREAFIQVRQAIAVVNSTINENVSGVRVIQSLSREDENSRRFTRINAGNLSANVRAGRLTAVVMPMVEVLIAVATGLVIIVGGLQVYNAAADARAAAVGTLVAFALYVQRFFDPVRDLVLQYTQIQRAMAGGERIIEVLDTRPEIADTPGAVELPEVRGEVVFEHVTFRYTEGVTVLEDVNLHVRPGETVAFVGQTGAGKSTMTALIARLYDVSDGRITIDGYDIRDVTRESLARQMGTVLQEPYLFSGTVRDNIRYGRLEASDEEIEAAARLVGAHDFIVNLEQGYDTMLHERGQNLSVGQRQLLSFARAILAQPRILILDEATANIDTQTERVIQDALKTLLKGRTSFVIAHRLSTIRDADRIVVLDRGRVIESGSHDELLGRDGAYATLYRMTFAGTGGATTPSPA